MIDTPTIHQTARQPTACIHLTIPRSQIGLVMGPTLAELKAALLAQGIAQTGPWLTHHLRAPTDSFDFEICLPVDVQVAPFGRMRAGELPPTTVARTVYHGPYESLAAGWGEFMAWIASNGYEPGIDLWERYIVGPESSRDSGQWQTELNRPVITPKRPG